MSVDPAIVQWLKSEALYVTASDSAVAAAWGALATESEIVTPLALSSGAAAEGARQIAFLGRPLVLDKHRVKGLRRDLLGLPIRLRGDRLGYETAPACFVIGYDELKQTAETMLAVLRRL